MHLVFPNISRLLCDEKNEGLKRDKIEDKNDFTLTIIYLVVRLCIWKSSTNTWELKLWIFEDGKKR